MAILTKISTLPPNDYEKESIKDKTEKLVKQLDDLQNLMFAENKRSLLIVLQGLDAAGKDGLIRKVFSEVNPMGCRVTAFKKPTEEESSHDFLWRIHRHTPSKGMIQIFNRSHYEDVLVPKVYKWVSDKVIRQRYVHINNFEKLLQDSWTTVLKFYLHISKEEQIERLRERISDPRKNWKYNPADMKERQKWEEYMDAYEDIFEKCSPEIHWIIVPADKNWYKEYLVAKIIAETLESFKMEYPRLNKE